MGVVSGTDPGGAYSDPGMKAPCRAAAWARSRTSDHFDSDLCLAGSTMRIVRCAGAGCRRYLIHTNVEWGILTGQRNLAAVPEASR
jgi:hypothetical protein